MRLNLGTLALNERASFTLYVGVTRTGTAALNAIGDIDPALHALAEPTSPGGAVGIFAISNLTHSTHHGAHHGKPGLNHEDRNHPRAPTHHRMMR